MKTQYWHTDGGEESFRWGKEEGKYGFQTKYITLYGKFSST
jgi:hypothetical protein